MDNNTAIHEYFVRNYTLVIDNDYEMYNSVTRAARHVLRDASDEVSLSEYLVMDDKARAERFADEIGEKVLVKINMWLEESISDRDHPGSRLAMEALSLSGSTMTRMLGEHFMPDNIEAADVLSDSDDEDDDEDDDE